MGNVDTLSSIWRGTYPLSNAREHSLLEKLIISPLLLLRIFAGSNLGVVCRNPTAFTDVYVLGWPFLLASLLVWPPRAGIAILLATYRIVTLLDYQFCVVLVDAQHPDWELTSARRSVVACFFNLADLVLGFALLYLIVGGVHTPDGLPLSSIGAIYFSLATMGTVGYGDYYPTDDATRLLASAQIVSAIAYVLTILPLFLSVLGAELQNRHPRTEKTR